jgi:hypothetical protein
LELIYRAAEYSPFLPTIRYFRSKNGRMWFSSKTVVPNLWYAYPWKYSKIILVMAENKKQSYEERFMWKLSLDPPTTSHIISLMLFLFVLILC